MLIKLYIMSTKVQQKIKLKYYLKKIIYRITKNTYTIHQNIYTKNNNNKNIDY